jgi:hypothetical protein
VGMVLTEGANVATAVGAVVGFAVGAVVEIAEGFADGNAVGDAGQRPVSGHVELMPYAIPEQDPNSFITHNRPAMQQAS